MTFIKCEWCHEITSFYMPTEPALITDNSYTHTAIDICQNCGKLNSIISCGTLSKFYETEVKNENQ